VGVVRVPVIPEGCRLRHEWGPGLVEIAWEPCDCPPALAARGGHMAVRCLARFGEGRCPGEWLAPLHRPVREGLLGHHRPVR